MSERLAEIKRLQGEFVEAVNKGTDTTEVLAALHRIQQELKEANKPMRLTARQKMIAGFEQGHPQPAESEGDVMTETIQRKLKDGVRLSAYEMMLAGFQGVKPQVEAKPAEETPKPEAPGDWQTTIGELKETLADIRKEVNDDNTDNTNS